MSPRPPHRANDSAERELHRRLIAAERTASLDLAEAYLEALIDWLDERYPSIDPQFVSDAAEDAILDLIRRPTSYDPAKLSLIAYLRMAARRDLSNRLRRERKHHKGRVSLESVELSTRGGNYRGQADDPSLAEQCRERECQLDTVVTPTVRRGLSEAEARVLDLMLRGERRHAFYAVAYGINHLPIAQQRREVKRVKDRLKKRLQRAQSQP